MDTSRAAHGNRAAADGLLVIVDSTGIPVLVRPYGDVQKPPSAAIGIVSAVFHAATTGDGTRLRALRAEHRSIVYVQQANDFLLMFAQSHTQDQAHFAEKVVERMLGLVFHALQMTIGPSLTEMESSRLRGAISRQLAIVDYICTHISTDVSLATGVPVLADSCRQSRFGEGVHPPSLLYGAHVRAGVVMSEFGSPSQAQPSGLDLVIFCGLANVAWGSQTTQMSLFINSNDKKTATKTLAVIEHREDGDCVACIFATDACESDLKLDKNGFNGECAKATGVSSDLSRVFADPAAAGLFCWLIVPCGRGLDPSGSQHAIFGSCEGLDDTLTPVAACQALSRFVSMCSVRSPSRPRRVDYKQQDESYTLIHCDRTPLSVFALVLGLLPMESVSSVGDLLASAYYVK